MSNAPDWMPVLMFICQGLLTLVIVFVGMVLRGIKSDVKEGNTKIDMLKTTLHQVETSLINKIHGLELQQTKELVAQEDFDKLSETVTEHTGTLTVLKARDELRWMEASQGRKAVQG